MKEKVIYNLVFNRKKHLNAEGKALIQVEAYWNRQKRYFSTKVYVKPTQWDNKRKVVRNHPNMERLNRHIGDYIAYLERIELDLNRTGSSFSLLDLKRKAEIESASSFVSFMKNEIDQSNLRLSTLRNHLSTLQILCRYRPQISFDDLTFDFLCGFEHFLLDQKYHRNTIAKHMKHLKKYINLAINKELFEAQKYPFRRYKIKYVESKRGYLTPEELGRLEKLAPQLPQTLRRILDMFLFSCYTGLRFSDVVNIRAENFHLIDNKLWLLYSSVKTEVNVRLPLFLLFGGKALALYEHYRNLYSGTLFGVSLSSNSNVNKRLKRICQLAEIGKRVSFHTARHTYATLLLYSGANITTVQKLLGHKSVRTTEIYSDIMDMTVIRDLERIRL